MPASTWPAGTKNAGGYVYSPSVSCAMQLSCHRALTHSFLFFKFITPGARLCDPLATTRNTVLVFVAS